MSWWKRLFFVHCLRYVCSAIVCVTSVISECAKRPYSQALVRTLALPDAAEVPVRKHLALPEYFPAPDSAGGRTATDAAHVREVVEMNLPRLEQALERA
jgi:hypothetical protein